MIMSKNILKRWPKTALLQAWVVGRLVRLANVPFEGSHNIELKSAVGKIKNMKGTAMSVGLLTVQPSYFLYVVFHFPNGLLCLFSSCLSD